MAHKFVALPKEDPAAELSHYDAVLLYDERNKPFRQVLWGDWLTLAEPDDLEDGLDDDEDWLWVRWAWEDEEKRRLLKIRREHTADERPLEIIFVDVGIGDGAVLISPERNVDADGDRQERIIVVDAGESDHMLDFLDKRFGAYREGFRFHAAVITHPDHDHYAGFRKILGNPRIGFDHVYHNGIVEMMTDREASAVEAPRGEKEFVKIGGVRQGPGGVDYLRQVVVDDAEMRTIFDPGEGRTNTYAKVIGNGIKNDNVGEFRMLGVNLGDAEDGRWWVPGFAPSDRRPYTIEVLGPWVEYPFEADDPALRLLGGLGETKNGHSVLLHLQFGKFSVLFGGDLNRPAEKFLLQQYAGLDAWPPTPEARTDMVEAAADRLRADVMKTCHHGSSDVTDEFIRAVHPAAFVISSGDQDANYVHPRPDLLGRLGKHGRGDSPVLLSTELQRSTRDIDNRELVADLQKKIRALVTGDGDDRAEKLDTELTKFEALALPSVAVDGAIYVKMNGDLLITAFKKETADETRKWFYYVYRRNAQGELELIPRERRPAD